MRSLSRAAAVAADEEDDHAKYKKENICLFIGTTISAEIIEVRLY